MPAVLRRIGLLTVAAAIAAPALPALAAGSASGQKPTAQTVASVFAKGHDPDMPGAGMDPTAYLNARTAYFNARAGNPLVKGKGNLRVAGIQKMHRQHQQEVAAAQALTSGDIAPTASSNEGSGNASGAADPTAPVATAPWSALGPSPLPNGQTNTFTINPPVSGRATAIAIDPTNKNIVYVAAAGGGVFRTTDGGGSWTPIADGMQVMAVGALAIAPSNHSILYVGTGESNLGLDSYAGVGLYRIDNADTTAVLSGPINPTGAAPWNDGRAFTGQSITRILVSPTDPASVLVSTNSAGVGKYGSYRANSGSTSSVRGIYRSTNATSAAGSVTFSTLTNSLGSSVGVSDMTFDPRDPNKVLAGVQAGSTLGLYLTSNVWAATPTWSHDTVPTGSYSLWRLAATAAGGTTTFYAADDAGNGTVRSSTDGVNWSAALPAFNGHCGGQCWYDDPVGVSPADANIVLAGGDGGSPLRRSADGGATQSGAVDSNLHPDAHALAFAPSDSSTVWLGNDGGVFKSTDSGNTWTSANTTGLNSLQFQSLAVHPTDPNFTIGGTQDNGTEWMHPDGTWIRADWGDGGASAIDQSSTSTTNVTMYHTYYNQTNNQIGFARVTSTPYAQQGYWSTLGCGGGNTANGITCTDATQFYAPLVLGPGTPNSVYFGTDRLYRSTNQGTTMSVVSQAPITAGATITAIGISPTTDNSRIVGLSNGRVWATTSGSSTLTDVTGGWPLVAGSSQVVVVDDTKIDPADPNTAFVGLGNYFGTSSSHLWKTSTLNNASPTWTGATGLPDVPVNAIAIDPSNHKYVYAGTDIGVYYSVDGGGSFAPLGTGLPAVAVFDMKIVQPGSNAGTLRIATHGRGVWQFPIGDGAKPASVTLSPTSASVIAGDSKAFTATAHYADGSTADVTSQATWSSDTPSVATVTAGTATSKAQGSAAISAVFHGVQGTATLTVTGAVLRSVAVSPATANVAKGQTTKLTATGTYSDGSTQDLSDSATWATDLPSVATVNTHGLVTGVAQGGPATISATVGTYMASSAVTVTPAVVTGVTVTPGTTSVPLGDLANFTATANWSDGSSTDVTSSATWSSSSTGVATISGGVATTKSTGGTTITATASGKSGTAALTVTAAVLRSVAVMPATVTVSKGLTTQLHATGTFSDSSTQDLTSTATWSSAATGTATVDTRGLVTGVAQGGPVAITATSAAKSGHADVTVGPAVVTALTITPASPSIALGDTRQMTATATWSDGSTTDASSLATWTSATTSVATIDSGGLATSVTQGTSVIGASYNGAADSTTLTVSAAALQSVTVAPHTATVAKGDNQTFTVTGHYSDGSTAPLTSGIVWSAVPSSTATVTSAGVATGVGVGDASVTATVGGRSDSATLTVSAPVLRRVAVSPKSVSMAKGQSVALTVTGTYSDGSTQDVTGSATWSSANSSVASVVGGLVHGAAQGATTVTATVGSYSDQSDIAVGPAVVTSLDVTASPTSVPLGDSSQMTAVATYSDASTQDVTSSATWASDTTSVATVAGNGQVTSKAVGTANISATYQGITHSAAVTVTGKVLRSISVTPATPSVPVGLTRQLTATGTYSDGSTQNITAAATWASATTANATVGAQGLVTAKSVGTSDVSAAINGVTASTTVTVTAPVVTSVDVTPGTTSVALGDPASFAATATWSDGSTTDVTSGSVWSSGNSSVATMTGALAHTVGIGTSTISAVSAGKTGTATLAVTAAEVRSLTVAPQTVAIAKGRTQQLTATGHFSDGSTQDLSHTATWSSGSTSVATVDPWGLVTGAGEGSTSVTATMGSLSDHADMSVGPAVVTGLAITPASPSVAKGDTRQLTATATWSDGSTTNASSSATWTSATPSVASIDSHGLVTSLTQGTTVIAASYGGSSDSTMLTVTAPALRSVTVAPNTATVAKGDTKTFTVTGHYSDGSTAPVTSGIVWSAAPAAVSTVTSAGVATGAGVGSASITATVGGFNDSATLTVTAAELRALVVAPSTASIAKGNNVPLTATGTYSDGSSQNLTGSAAWSSADSNVATVDGTGLVHGAAVGQTTVAATVGTVTDHATITVGPAAVTALDVTTSPVSVPAGDQSQATATATMSDGSTQDVTSLATWSTDHPTVATVSGGLVSSHAPGTAQISAAYQGFSHAATLTVTGAVLRSIAVTPAHPSIPVGLTRQLAATGMYSDGSQLDVTDSATWSSGTASVATVGTHGLVTAAKEGTSTVTATVGTVSSGTPVDVTAPVVTAVNVTPGSTSAVKGDPVSFTAAAVWSDGTSTDVTSSAVWASGSPSVATMSGAVASTVGVGTSTISATSNGKTGTALLTVDAAALRSIVVAPGTANIARGLTAQLTATGHYSDGTTQDLTQAVTWQSDRASVATVDHWGLVSGAQQGTATVTATIDSLSDHSDITVGAPVVTGITIMPVGPSVPAGDTRQFAATATWSAGSPTDVTDLVTWVSGTATTATIDSHGLATGVAPGVSTISATYGTLSDSTTLTVTAPELRSVTVSPHTASIAKGDTQAFTVTGRYSDGSSSPVTSGIAWTTGDASVASVTSAGVASGLTVGSTGVTATVGDVSDAATLTVTAAELRIVSVSPASTSVAKGQDVGLSASGTFSDGSSHDVTNSVSWSSSDDAIATVGSHGLLHGVAEGQVTITASANGHSADATVTVGPAVVTGFHVQATPTSVPLGENAHMTAVADMSDGTHPDVTGAAAWSSSDDTVATVDSNGLVVSKSVGTAEITGTYQGVIDSAVVTVSDAVLQSIAVTPQSPHVARGLTTQLTATGTYSDRHTEDLTQTAIWSPADAATATVDQWGMVTGVSEGTTAITATVDSVSSHVDVTVDPAVVTDVSVTTDNPIVPKGKTQQYVATATWSAGSPTDVSDLATWSSDTPSFATVDSHGLVTAVDEGNDFINATYGGVTGSAWLYVGPATVSSVTLATTATQLANGRQATLTLTGHYTDGSSAVIPSDEVNWTSSDQSVAWVSAGTVTAVGEGSATIGALARGQRDSFDLTVGPAVLDSLSIAPDNISMAVGNGMGLTAVGMYSDGQGHPVTDPVTWSTANGSVATVDSSGNLTGVAIGHTTVTAAAGGRSATATVDITAPPLVDLEVSATPQTVPLGDHTQVHATGTRSDASVEDLTNAVAWSSDDPTVAKVSSTGAVTSVGQGDATILATYTDGQVQWMKSTVVSVTPAALRSLVVTPSTYTVKPTKTKQYVATGTFSDGTKRNVSSTVHWSTGSTKIAKVGATGVVTGVAYGSTAVRAVSGAISATAVTVHVTHKAPTVTGLSPAKGKVATLITITGSNFVKKPVMTVKFGTTKAGTITYVSSTKIRVRVPKGARSAYVYVTNDGGTGRSKVSFKVLK